MDLTPSPLGRDLAPGVRSFNNSTLISRLTESTLEALDTTGVDDRWVTRVSENAVAHIIAELEVCMINSPIPMSFEDAISFLRARVFE